jgi:hypothetical protein
VSALLWLLAAIACASPFAVFALICWRLRIGPLDRQLAEHERQERLIVAETSWPRPADQAGGDL